MDPPLLRMDGPKGKVTRSILYKAAFSSCCDFSAAIGSCGFCRGWRTDSGGNVGMATGLFQSGQNGAPEKPFINNMNYNTIQGLMTVEGKGPFIREAEVD